MTLSDSQQSADSPSESDPERGSETAASPPRRDSSRRGRGPERTRTSVAFNSLVAGAIVLILLLVFILENTRSVSISYFGATGHISLGVALLLAAVGGALLAGLLGGARVLQLRRRIKHPRS